MLGPDDDIARFEYLKKSARNFGSVRSASKPGLRPCSAAKLDQAGFVYRDITDDETLAEFLILGGRRRPLPSAMPAMKPARDRP